MKTLVLLFIMTTYLGITNITNAQTHVDYSEIGRKFNDMIQSTLADREKQKAYYDDLTINTKNTIYSNSILTNDYAIDKKVFQSQQDAIHWIDIYNRNLKQGFLKPNDYVEHLKQISWKFTNANRQITYLAIYKKSKLSSLRTTEEKREFNQSFDGLLDRIHTGIKGFSMDDKYKGSINTLGDFIALSMAASESRGKQIDAFLREEKEMQTVF